MRHAAVYRYGLAGLILAGLCWQLVRAPPDWSTLGHPDLSALAIAACAAIASTIAMANVWARLRGRAESWIDVGAVWFPSLLARYLPGGVWQGAVRAIEGRRRGEAVADNLGTFAAEQALACFSAALLALALQAAGPPMPAWLVGGLVATATAAAVGLVVLGRMRLGPRWSTGAFAWTLAGHSLIAAAFAAFVAAFAPDAATATDLLVSARAFLVAGLAGILAVFVPAGLGVREGLIAWLLAPSLGGGVALAIALLARVGLVGCELAAWGVWAVARRVWRGG